MNTVLGLDTSNYTTSVAVFNGRGGHNESIALQVRPGELGLRQSDALFQHIKSLPVGLARLEGQGLLQGIAGVGASTRPRAVDGSYMPCFLAGASQGESLAKALGVPFFSCSHQQGHLAAAAWSAGRIELLDGPFLAWHLSGGTTELLRVEPGADGLQTQYLGGTSDISAGQLIDRTGVLLGLPFPAGRALDELYGFSEVEQGYRVKLNEMTFSLSGMENKVKDLLRQGETSAAIARFTLDTVIDVVVRATCECLRRWPGLPVLCSGGVAANSRLREVMQKECGALFAKPQFSADNAMGTAILAWRALGRGI